MLRPRLALFAALALGAALFARASLAEPDTEPAAKPTTPVAGPFGSRLHRDLEHTRLGSRSVKLDLYRPPATTPAPYPVVVWVHGGGWIGGAKTDCPSVAMTTQGYAVASVEYRLSSEAPFPAQIEDCKAAVRWVRANAAAYGLDASHVGAAGASAGGHLVALLGTAGDAKDLEGKGLYRGVSSRVDAVCDFFGPTDLTRFDGHGSTIVAAKSGSIIETFLGGPLEKKKDVAKQANPITYVTKDDPPFLILHGDKDPIVPLDQSEILQKALESVGVSSRLVVEPGAGHGWYSDETNKVVLAFFDEHLKSRKPIAKP